MTAHETQEARQVRRMAEAALAWVSAHRDGFRLGEDALAERGNVNLTWKPSASWPRCASVYVGTPIRPTRSM